MDRGLESFCNRKQINAIKTVKMFTKETGFKVEDNFARFASFVDKKIKSGELQGNDAPLNKDMWEEIKDINYANSRKEHYNKVYNDYLDLAEGNEKMAYTFFSKAYSTLSLSDIDKEIVDGILSAPTCEETLTA
jgi:hypothetical protein